MLLGRFGGGVTFASFFVSSPIVISFLVVAVRA
jgi:hypothetical protein